jgi:hypothetical protein
MISMWPIEEQRSRILMRQNVASQLENEDEISSVFNE